MNNIKKIISVVIFASLTVIISNSHPAMAASLEESPEFQKALATSLSACYTRGAFRDEITLASYGASGSVKSVLSSTSSNVSAPIPYGYTSSSVQLPSMSCSNILSHALSKKSLSIPAKFEDAGSVLTKLGYTKVVGRDLDNEKTCFWFEYDVNVDDIEWINGGGDYRTRDEVWKSEQVCLTEYTDESSGQAMTRLDSINADNGGNNKILDIAQEGNTSVIKFQTQSWGVNDDWIRLDAHRNGTAADFMLSMYNAIIATKHGRTGTGEAGSYVNRYTLKGYQDQSTPVGSEVAGTSYILQAGAAKTVPEDLFGVTRLFDQTNTYILYQNYLMKFYGAMTLQVNPNDPTQDSLRTGADKDLGGYKKIKVYNKGKIEECYVKPKKTSGKLYGVSNNRFGGIDATSWQYPSPVFQVGYDDIVKFLNGTTPSGSELKAHSDYIVDANCAADNQQEQTKPSNPSTGGGTTTDDDDDATVSQCIEAAGALGWIMCPVLDIASEATESLYSYISNNFLEIGSDIMGANMSTHNAWKTFRDYANIVFIIIFLIVILSQITGFGISNYGIKKILPRLIAVVLLTNLSFIICQLAVDVSNIVGAGLNDALSSLGGVKDASEATYGVNNVINGARAALFGTTLTGLAIAGVTWRLWLLPLLLAIIGALAGVFMFFLSLAVRQAGIIILVVLCPVAIICYALPNTKKFFDKWFKIFSSLLLVYPICGLLMGGGDFASSLLTNLGQGDDNVGFMFTLTAMLLSVVPFFFIPTLVRTSLNAIGQLGARLNNFGRGMSGRLTGAVRNSEGFRNKQRELAMRRDEQTVRNLDRWSKVRSAVGLKAYSKSGQRRRSLAYARADKARREDLIGESYSGRKLLRYDKAREAQLLSNLETKDLEEGVAGNKALYRTDPKMAKEENITAEHNKVLEQFGDSPDDNELYKKLFALEQMDMEKGAPGYDLMWQSISGWIAKNNENNSWTSNKRKALSKLSAGLATRYGKELNNFDKGANAALNHFAEGNFDKLGSFRSAIGKNGKEFYRSDYDTKLSSYSAAGLLEASPGALQRGMEALRTGDFVNNAMDANGVIDPDKARQLKADERTLLGNITKAFDNDLIADKFKPTEKGYLQDAMGYGASMPGYSSVITNLGQGSLESVAQFVDGATESDSSALNQLGQNIQDAAASSRIYSEDETKRIRMILNKIKAKTGMEYSFNPASMRIDQSNSSPIITGADAEEAFRNRNRS